MPSIYGSVGCSESVAEALKKNHSEVWLAATQAGESTDFIAGHSFNGSAIFSLNDGLHVAVDGEASIYGAGKSAGQEALFCFRDGFLHLSSPAVGNVAVLDPRSREVFLAVDWTGSFPLYYARHENGFLFSSHLRPLAKSIGASTNLGALRDFLETDCVHGDETFYREIHRVLPGQSLSYRLNGGRFLLAEHSRFWVGEATNAPDPAERCWAALEEAVRKCHSATERVGLMMSGGFDSRTILEPLRKTVGDHRILLYSHGDLASRELGIVRDIANLCSLDSELVPINSSVFDLNLLELGFRRTETVVHPHFLIAGQKLAARGIQTATSGVLGEVLAGRYGPASLPRSRLKQFWRYSQEVFPFPRNERDLLPSDLDALAEEMVPHAAPARLSFLGREFWSGFEASLTQNDRRHKVRLDLERLYQRGTCTLDRIVEAYIVEHRGIQYILSQVRASRAFCNIGVPFGNRDLLNYASKLPRRTRLVNRINRLMLRRHAPHLLSMPTADACFVSARSPLLVRTASKISRRLLQHSQDNLHSWSHGTIPRPRFGWLDLDCIRNYEAVKPVIDDLRCEFWDRNAFLRQVQERTHYDKTQYYYRTWLRLFKIYTADRMLR